LPAIEIAATTIAELDFINAKAAFGKFRLRRSGSREID
jgi:hypothetical protein